MTPVHDFDAVLVGPDAGLCSACGRSAGEHDGVRVATQVEWGIRRPGGAVRWPNEAACREHAARHRRGIARRMVTTITSEWQPVDSTPAGAADGWEQVDAQTAAVAAELLALLDSDATPPVETGSQPAGNGEEPPR